ncbi:MAG: sugar phosphate nucleotidyltransferase [Chloroflexota bacterium]
MPDPQRFGVAEFGAEGSVVGFEEKPAQPKRRSIPIGVYFLRPDAFGVIEGLVPSGAGEFEIARRAQPLHPQRRPVPRHFGGVWQDAGTIDCCSRRAWSRPATPRRRPARTPPPTSQAAPPGPAR